MKILFNRIVVALLCVLLVALAPVAAQAPGATVTGTVTDQTGAVVVNAEVQMLSLASGRQLKTNTDSSGKYEFTGLPSAPYQISVNTEGFAVSSRSVSLRRNDAFRADFLLTPGPIEIDVTVTAGKGNARVAAETPQTVTVTGALQIEERRPASTLRSLDKAPNLTPVNANPTLERSTTCAAIRFPEFRPAWSMSVSLNRRRLLAAPARAFTVQTPWRELST
jgi:hypothetical protein